MKRMVNVIAALLGFAFLFLAFFYWLMPANALPYYMPGYDPVVSTVHVVHGLISMALAFIFFLFAWLNSAKKAS